MFNFFKKRRTNRIQDEDRSVNNNRGNVNGFNGAFNNLRPPIFYPSNKQNNGQAQKNDADNNKKKGGLSIEYTPTPEAGVRYPDMGPFEKREIFRHDARRMIYHRGRRYAMAYVASEKAKKVQVEFLISEYKSIVQVIIAGLKKELLKKEAIYKAGNELIKEQLEPILENMRTELTYLQEQIYLADEMKGEVSHAIKAFNRGWELGAMEVISDVDLKAQATEEVVLREEKGDL